MVIAVALQVGVAELPLALLGFEERPADVLGPGVVEADPVDAHRLRHRQVAVGRQRVRAKERIRRILAPVPRAVQAIEDDFIVRADPLPGGVFDPGFEAVRAEVVGREGLVSDGAGTHGVHFDRWQEFLVAVHRHQPGLEHRPRDLAHHGKLDLRRLVGELHPRAGRIRGRQRQETSIGFCGAYAVALAACSTCSPSSHSVPFPSSRSACDGASRTGLKGSSTRCHWSPDSVSGSCAHTWPLPPVTIKLPSQSPRTETLSTWVSKLHGTANGAL